MAHTASGARPSGLIGDERVRAGILLAVLAMLLGSLPALMRRSSLASFGAALRSHAAGQCGPIIFCDSPRGKKRVIRLFRDV